MVLPPAGVRAGPTERRVQQVRAEAHLEHVSEQKLGCSLIGAQTTATTTPVRPSSNYNCSGPSNISGKSNPPAQSSETAAQVFMYTAPEIPPSSLERVRSTEARQTAAASATSDSSNSPVQCKETAAQAAMITPLVTSSSSLDPARSTAARQTAAVAAVRTSAITPVTLSRHPTENIRSRNPIYVKRLLLQAVRTKMYKRSCARIDHVPACTHPNVPHNEAIDYHLVRTLPRLVRDEAASVMQQLPSETLEWRTDKAY